MKDSTYAKFEDNHRGSLSAISERLSVYKPLLKEFKSYNPDAFLVDLGCGRGDFLKIATDLSIECFGIDSNEDMLGVASQLDFNVEKADALEYLTRQEDNSLDILSAIHLIEHFNSGYLIKIIDQIERVLRPGGLVILETPNPENIIVSTCNFYMDMSHVKPLPPQLLKFIFQNQQFEHINLWGLNSKKKLSEGPVALIDILGGVSPDYALLALKKTTSHSQKTVVSEIEISRGISLNELANLYEQRWGGEIKNVVNSIDQSGIWINEELSGIKKKLKRDLANHGSSIESLHSEVQGMYSDIQVQICSIHEQAHFYQTELQRVTRSRSWRVTYPLRYMGKIARTLKNLIKTFFFDFKNFSKKVFLKKYWGKLSRKILPRLFNNKFINELDSSNSFVSSKEKKFLSILEKIQKEK